MQTVLITGGTGLIGSRLSELLTNKGYKVIHLSRRANPNAPYPAYKWDIPKGYIDENALTQADYIISLAGAGIADKRWTKARKQLIIDSRVNGILLIKKKLEAHQIQPKAIIGASAMGFYGDSGQQIMTEKSEPGDGFLAESVMAWEGAYDELEKIGVRLPRVRVGLVLSPNGGALEKMLLTYKAGVGTYFGDGSQVYSWIHLDDIARIFIHLLENETTNGIYNGAAPHPVSNKELAKAISRAKNIPEIVVPAPAFALKLAMGEMAAAVLSSNNLSAQKILDSGFEFHFPKVDGALEDLLK